MDDAQTAPDPVAEDVAAVRASYEDSVSWRVTRPVRALGGAVRRLRGDGPNGPAPASGAPTTIPLGSYDSWLAHLHAEQLGPIEDACAAGGPGALSAFRGLGDDLWTVLLSREYTLYSNIRATLPGAPERQLQINWNGESGLTLLNQSKAFYAKARDRFEADGNKPLSEACILDYGCGWGRLTRFFARDVAPGALCGCDPVQSILDVCEHTRVPADLRLCDFLPERLPFEQNFDLVFSFSVLTHISEGAHLSVLRAIHSSLNPGGILIVTIRPPAYLALSELMHPALHELGPDPLAALEEPRYIFVPHPADPDHPQYHGEDMSYGESVISLPYVRERWADLFEVLDVSMLTGDMHQVAVTLRRRD